MKRPCALALRERGLGRCGQTSRSASRIASRLVRLGQSFGNVTDEACYRFEWAIAGEWLGS
jgi:hypothetical protein